jgi:hypothetical protein
VSSLLMQLLDHGQAEYGCNRVFVLLMGRNFLMALDIMKVAGAEPNIRGASRANGFNGFTAPAADPLVHENDLLQLAGRG